MHPMQDLFLESFSQVLKFDMCSYLHKKFFFCKKWVLQAPTQRRAMRVGSFVAYVPACGSAWRGTDTPCRSLPARQRRGEL
jgi:hypothetical protein